MTARKYNSALACLFLCVWAAGLAGYASAQSNLIGQPGGVRPSPNRQPPGQSERSEPDLFDMMVSSAASFDIDSPVEAQAEFDPPVVAAGGRALYRIEISALDESLTVPEQLPAVAGLEVRAGGRGQSYQPSGNQKLRPLTMVIYRAVAAKTGTYTMPAFDLMAYGKPVKVPAATLTVVEPGAVAAREPPELQLELPKGDCYVGQLLRIRMLLPVPPDGGVMGLTQPRITGEFIFSEQFSAGMRSENVQRDGKTFQAWVQEVAVTPLREGPLELVGQAHSYVLRPSRTQTNVIHSTSMLIDSEPVTLSVKALPAAGVLPGFTGAVGDFRIDQPRLSIGEVRAGEPVTLLLLVRGDGNLGRIVPPPLPALRDWQTFPPVADMTSSASIQQRGFASFKYTLIPLDDHITATPAIPFSSFDPQKGAYVDLTIPPVPLAVTPGAGGEHSLAQTPEPAANHGDFDSPYEKEKEPVLSGLAKSPGKAASSLTPLQQRGWFLALQLLPAGALAGWWGWERRRRYLALHPEVILKSRARRGLRRQWRGARRAAAARDAAGFATSTANALREACAPHHAANPGALVCADVLRELPDEARQGRAGEMIRRLFAAADAQRFGGPVRDGADLLALQPDLERLLEELRGRL